VGILWKRFSVFLQKDCYEVYALVPGLLREEVHVQSDPAGRLIVTGEPEQLDNPWGVTPFKKVISLPSRIDPHQTSAVVTLHGQLFVRAPFEQSKQWCHMKHNNTKFALWVGLCASDMSLEVLTLIFVEN
jgi:HSP20 family molecular chaperone IbpA